MFLRQQVLPDDTDAVLRDGGALAIIQGELLVLSREALVSFGHEHWRVWSDASWNHKAQIAGAGAWISSPCGEHIASLSTAQEIGGPLSKSFGAEVFALCEAAELAREVGALKVRFRFDCLPLARRVVRVLLCDEPSNPENDLVHMALTRFDSVVLEWTPRCRNLLADRLSRMRVPGAKKAALRSVRLHSLLEAPVAFADEPVLSEQERLFVFEPIGDESIGNAVILSWRESENRKSIWAAASFVFRREDGTYGVPRASRRYVCNKGIQGRAVSSAAVEAVSAAARKLFDAHRIGVSSVILVGDELGGLYEPIRKIFGKRTRFFLAGRDSAIGRIGVFLASREGVSICMDAKRRSASWLGLPFDDRASL